MSNAPVRTVFFEVFVVRWTRRGGDNTVTITVAMASQADKVSLLRPIWRQFAVPMFVAWMCKQSADLLGFVGPVALKGVVQFMENQQNPEYEPPTEATVGDMLSNGWVLALTLFLAPFLQSLLLQMYYFLTVRVGSNVQSALLSMVYHKVCTSTHGGLHTVPRGDLRGQLSAGYRWGGTDLPGGVGVYCS